MHGHQGWNVRHGLCHIYMRYVYMSYLQLLFVLLFVHYCNIMVCVVYCVCKWQGWGQFNSGIGIAAQFQFQFGNWNWNCNWWNWKWNWNWKLWNWNWKPELNFLQLLPQNLLVNQQFPNFSFNRGHNLPCDWLLMQQGCFKFLEHCPPVVWSQKTQGRGRVPCSPWIINQNRNACT